MKTDIVHHRVPELAYLVLVKCFQSVVFLNTQLPDELPMGTEIYFSLFSKRECHVIFMLNEIANIVSNRLLPIFALVIDYY